MSYKVEVESPTGSWSSNSLRFATKEEAEAAGRELLSRWAVPISSRATETPNDPANRRFDFEQGRVALLDEAKQEATT